MNSLNLDIDIVRNLPDTPSLAHWVMAKTEHTQYYALSDFLQEVSPYDLTTLVFAIGYLTDQQEMVNDVSELPPEAEVFMHMIRTVAMLLISSEGAIEFFETKSECFDQLAKDIIYFNDAVVCESLARKGILLVDYANVSFEESRKNPEVSVTFMDDSSESSV